MQSIPGALLAFHYASVLHVSYLHAHVFPRGRVLYQQEGSGRTAQTWPQRKRLPLCTQLPPHTCVFSFFLPRILFYDSKCHLEEWTLLMSCLPKI